MFFQIACVHPLHLFLPWSVWTHWKRHQDSRANATQNEFPGKTDKVTPTIFNWLEIFNIAIPLMNICTRGSSSMTSKPFCQDSKMKSSPVTILLSKDQWVQQYDLVANIRMEEIYKMNFFWDSSLRIWRITGCRQNGWICETVSQYRHFGQSSWSSWQIPIWRQWLCHQSISEALDLLLHY